MEGTDPSSPTVSNTTDSLRRRTEVVIFGTDTPAGRTFDIALLVVILASVLTVMMDSVPAIHRTHGQILWHLEIGFTAVFSVEFMTRIWCAEHRRAYLGSFWGIVDLLAILPTYIALFLPEAAPLVVVRLLRVVRVFRVLKLMALFAELNEILGVLKSTARSIFVFLIMVMIVVVVFACIIYVVEGPANGFDSIPMSIYWAVVTITTVGYGDLVPQTPAGRFIAGFGMLVGYSIIAVPTAIITRELWERINERGAPHPMLNWNCPVCAKSGHNLEALFCQHCGSELDVPSDVRHQEAEHVE
jgi:voltage-gated potassium channel